MSKTLETVLKEFIDQVVLDYKSITGMIGNLANLPSDLNKTNLVAALTSLNTKIANATGINDAATAAGSTWSSNKIQNAINSAVAALVDGAPDALNTLKELATQMAADESVLTSVVTALANRVRIDAAQSFTDAQKQQGLDNLGAVSRAELGNPSFDFASYYNTQKAAV